jgi:hypothetical protein
MSSPDARSEDRVVSRSFPSQPANDFDTQHPKDEEPDDGGIHAHSHGPAPFAAEFPEHLAPSRRTMQVNYPLFSNDAANNRTALKLLAFAGTK